MFYSSNNRCNTFLSIFNRGRI